MARSSEQIATRLKVVLAEEFEIEESQVAEGPSLRGTLAIDSLDLVDLGVLINDEFGVKLNQKELKEFKSFDDLVAIIAQNQEA